MYRFWSGPSKLSWTFWSRVSWKSEWAAACLLYWIFYFNFNFLLEIENLKKSFRCIGLVIIFESKGLCSLNHAFGPCLGCTRLQPILFLSYFIGIQNKIGSSLAYPKHQLNNLWPEYFLFPIFSRIPNSKWFRNDENSLKWTINKLI